MCYIHSFFAQLDPSSFTSSFANRTTNFFDHGSSLDECELDPLLSWKGKKSTDDMYTELASSRQAQGIAPVCISSIRKALNGVTHRRGRSQTRGRKGKVSKRGVEALDRTRRRSPVLSLTVLITQLATSSRTKMGATRVGRLNLRMKFPPPPSSRVLQIPLQCPYNSPTVPLQFPYRKNHTSLSFLSSKRIPSRFSFFENRN